MISESEARRLRLIWDNMITGERNECVDALPISIGRASSLNTIVLDNKQVSRQHAWLESEEGQIIIVDRDSTNGTYIEGRPIKRAALSDGDNFRIGPFNFTCTYKRPVDTPPYSTVETSPSSAKL